MNLSISRRLSEIEAILSRNGPEKLFIQLIDGTVEIADALTIWDYFENEVKRQQVTDVWTESPGFEELAGVVKTLCVS